jgi:drug/metabolite transporter (DMT)-like permease
VPVTKQLGLAQFAVALVALAGITMLGMTGNVSSDAIVGIYGAVIGAALGYANGTREGYSNGRRDEANGAKP